MPLLALALKNFLLLNERNYEIPKRNILLNACDFISKHAYRGSDVSTLSLVGSAVNRIYTFPLSAGAS